MYCCFLIIYTVTPGQFFDPTRGSNLNLGLYVYYLLEYCSIFDMTSISFCYKSSLISNKRISEENLKLFLKRSILQHFPDSLYNICFIMAIVAQVSDMAHWPMVLKIWFSNRPYNKHCVLQEIKKNTIMMYGKMPGERKIIKLNYREIKSGLTRNMKLVCCSFNNFTYFVCPPG